MIVVGIDDPGAVASSRLQIFEYSEDTRWVIETTLHGCCIVQVDCCLNF